MSYITVLLSRASCFEALAAINGSVAGGLECQLCLAAAVTAGCDEVLTLASFSIFLLVAASLAALRLILKALLCVELLLSCREYKLLTAVSAHESDILVYYLFSNFYLYFVFAHCFLPHFYCVNDTVHFAFTVNEYVKLLWSYYLWSLSATTSRSFLRIR